MSACISGRRGGDRTCFKDFSFPELTVWRMNRLLRAVIPTHGYPEFSHPSAARVLESGERTKPVGGSRFFQLIALKNLTDDGFARIIRVTQVQPIRDSDLPTPILDLLHELSVLRRNSERRDGPRSLAFRGIQGFGRARPGRERCPIRCSFVRRPTWRVRGGQGLVEAL